MKNTILTILGLLLFGCSTPTPVDMNDKRIKTVELASQDVLNLTNHSTKDQGILTLTFNNDSGYTFYNFEGELNFDDTKITLKDITNSVPTVHGIFVWNDNLIGGNYTEKGFRRAKFAYADSSPIGLSGTENLVKFEFDVKKTSKVCVVNFLYGSDTIINKVCETVSAQSNPTRFTIGAN
jgi:hypothetical protein